MARPVNTVALVDLHWEGHHATSFRLFASALAELGVDVVPFVPAPQDIPGLLADTPAAAAPGTAARLLQAESFQAPPYLPLRPPWLRRLQREAWTYWRLRHGLAAWERRTGRTIDLVFFSTIYDHDFSHASSLSGLLGYDWSGYYVQARCIHSPGAPMPNGGSVPDGRRMFRARRLRSLAVVDAGAVERMKDIVTPRKVVLFPEVTDARTARDDVEAGLALKVREFARGRPVVGLVGHIHRSKGIETFTAAARDPRLADVVFFVGGAASLVGLPPDIRRSIARTWEAAPNIFAHLQRIVDERTFNTLIQACDVLYAAYVDFPHSSSILTKAAVFQRPIIVSEGHLMGEQVRRYGLGITVPQDDVEGVVRGILQLTADRPPAPRPGWEQYASLHSYARLREAFGEIVG